MGFEGARFGWLCCLIDGVRWLMGSWIVGDGSLESWCGLEFFFFVFWFLFRKEGCYDPLFSDPMPQRPRAASVVKTLTRKHKENLKFPNPPLRNKEPNMLHLPIRSTQRHTDRTRALPKIQTRSQTPIVNPKTQEQRQKQKQKQRQRQNKTVKASCELQLRIPKSHCQPCSTLPILLVA